MTRKTAGRRKVDGETKQWFRDKSDPRAARRGCYFSAQHGLRAVAFIERFCKHSLGEFAGKPFKLLAWQKDFVMRLFGWRRKDGRRRFTRAFLFVPKKNGKSTLLAAIGLYLLVGDGELGARVYSAANDRQQASIIHGEAMRMVEMSEVLDKHLKINYSTKVIADTRTNSSYQPLAKGHRSQEGINAHGLLIDELHSWNDIRYWNSLRYAFRGRRQPLQIVITTAGDDDLSVCKTQYTYAKQVISGEVDDDRLLALIFEASPEDDWKDPEVWKKANPSFGVTIDPEEFAHDVEEVMQLGPADIATFKRYSLNIWSTGTNPAIRAEDWQACALPYTLDELEGCPCFGGLDLSKTQDTTAFVLVFPWGEDRFRAWPWFWLPEARIHAKDAPPQYLAWAKSGHLEVCPGRTIDYQFVRRRIVEISQRFQLVRFAYDPHNAETLIQQLEEEDGLERKEFTQNYNSYNDPCQQFSRLVINGTFHHADHPVFTWQVGNAQFKTSAEGYVRPVKPPHEQPRKIDGVVSAIMALALAMEPDNTPSISVL
jgi:phage terminase large subunit-like protein